MRLWLAAACLVLVACSSTYQPLPTNTPTGLRVVRPGNQGVIWTDGVGSWHLGADKESWARWNTLARANDLTGQNQMVREGKAFRVLEGTKVLVLAIELPGSLEVRVLDGPAKDRSGWIEFERVKPS